MVHDWQGDKEEAEWATPVTSHRINGGITDNPLCDGAQVRVHWSVDELPAKWSPLPMDPDPDDAASICEFYHGSAAEPTRLAIIVT